MSSQLKLRRGSSASHAMFTGAQGEVTFDSDTKELVAHDGATPGGFPAVGKKALAAPGGASWVGYDGGTAQDVLDSAKGSSSFRVEFAVENTLV